MRSSLFLKSGVAFLDQAVLSASNFVTAIVLMKTVPKEEYGYYSIAFAVSLFLIALQNAVVTTPLAVLLAGKKDEAKEEYAGALFWGQLIAVIPTAAIGLAATGILYMLGFGGLRVLTIGAVCFAAVGILLREFSRAYYFARQSPLTVLRLDSGYTLTYLVLIALAWGSFRITTPIVFVLMGISAVITSVLLKRHAWKPHWPAIRAGYLENWPFAKWSLTGVAVTHIQSYCILYLTGTLLGSAAAGSVAASRLPLTPMTLLQTGWNKVAIPRGAHLREGRQLRQFLREQMLVAAIVAAAVVVYVAALWMSAPLLKAVLFNKGYENALDFLAFWAAINIAGFTALSASVGLQVMKEFGVITKVNAVTMVITLGLNAVLLSRYGIKGGLTSSVIGESLLALSLWWCVARRYRREAARESVLPNSPPKLGAVPFARFLANGGVVPEETTSSARVSVASQHLFERAGTPPNLGGELSVCIATYRRPELLDRLLQSIEGQVPPDGVTFEVLVVDNDSEQSAAPIIAKHHDTKRITFRYFVQHEKNISITRNMAVANATGSYLLFIDDDEVATPGWAAALLDTAKRYNADGVFGPLVPIFDNETPEWIRKGERQLYGAMPDLVTGTKAEKTWTGNCLVKASVLKSVPGPFNPEYGTTGGEDTELFNRLVENGARLVYCREARVFEYFPPERTRVSYLLKRGLKGGNSHTRRTIASSKRKGLVRGFMLAKAVTFGILSLGLSIVTLPSRMWRTYWQMKLAANVGRFMAVVGQHYRSYE